jgi:sugar lactone lactonase YvrE
MFESCQKADEEQNTEERLPKLSMLLPDYGWEGDTITVIGKNFSTEISHSDIKVNDKPLTIVKSWPDSIKVIVPADLGSGLLKLTVQGNTYIGPHFTFHQRAIVTTVAGTGEIGRTDGDQSVSSFNCPWGLAFDASGNLYVADVYNRLIRKISIATNTVSSYELGLIQFYSPYNIAFDKSDNMYVTDFNRHLLKIAADGSKSVIYDNETMIGTGVAVDANNNLFVTDNIKGTITKLTTDGKNPVLFASGLLTPRNIVFSKEGSMYVATNNIIKVSTTGSLSVAAYSSGFQGWEIAIDAEGNFYQADHFKNVIKKIDKRGNIHIIAGSGQAADVDGVGTEASFNGPQGIAIDSEGNLYVSTYNYDTRAGNKIRKIRFE